MRLIVNADDFGLTTGVSRAILYGMANGILTDTSALVTAPGFAASVALAQNAGVQAMGVHVLLTMGTPALPPEKVPSLVDANGRFYTRDQFLNRTISFMEVEAEIEAQIRLLKDSGLRLNHIDCHHGLMNTSSQMRELFIHLALRHGVPLRNEASRYCPPEIQQVYRDCGVQMTDHLYLNHHGVPTHKVEHVLDYLGQAQKQYELVEIGCHPGYNDKELESLSPLNRDREIELAVMTDAQILQCITANGIKLASYSEAFQEVQ